AVAYASALGLFELELNGRRAGDAWFAPGWSDYAKRAYYRAFDVTGLVQPGANGLGAVVADGWYAGYVGFGGGRDHYGDRIRLLAQLVVEHADGTSETLATGPDWKASTGPLLEADFLMGESYDARKELPGWDSPGFDDSSWSAADVTEKIAARIEAHPGPPVNELGALKPIQVTEPAKGRFVFDLGQNFAGVARLKMKGSPGQAITLRFAEMLSPDGNIYTENLRSARATDRYICRGGGEEEVWQPRFTFHGFRYVELTGCSSRPDPEAITGIPLSSNTPVVGRFQCSNDLVNKLFSNISWTQRMNFIDIPTDCPQRDERLGWTGDAQIYCRTACRITDAQAFFTKWFIDLADAQREDGQFPMVAPLKSKGVTADGGPAWADAGVICPWTVYDLYGDRDVIEKHYASMRRFIDFSRNRSTPDLLPPASFHCFGDWLNIRAETPKEVIYIAYFANSTRLFARMAEALGRKDDAERYGELFEKIKAAFNRAYVAPDGRILGHTQTGYALALSFDLLDAEKRELAAQHLIDDIQGRGWRLSTGFIGTKDLMLVLSRIGRTEVAYRLLLNTTFPSWGFSIQHGATTIWERWNGWTPESGFFEPSMNSFAHYSFGAVGQWLFEIAGGVNTDGPGFRKIIVRPQPGGGLTWMKTSYDSIRGRIESSWEMDGGRFSLSIRIPANTTATVFVPAAEAAQVTEGGKPAARSEGVKFLREEGGAAVFEVGSGDYSFASTMKKSG
ncbi:MAG: glycoside hydrolase family 78 protein, partial [Planctomycetes bacterium]|nr:glycoside hydrolase family 78 protein [Planctomycetota bacterium]